MKSFFRVALLALLLVIVALVSALTAMRFAIHGQEVAVPALVGLTPADAERAAAALGLQIQIERQYYSAQIPEGRITSQLPMPGTKVRRGWDLRVAQSLGPQRVAIPDVAGESERAAELNIRRRGLDISSIAQMQMPGTPADQVLAQSPPANASQVAAPKINLLVTAAVDGQAYVMPSFIGQPLGAASRGVSVRVLLDPGEQTQGLLSGIPNQPVASELQARSAGTVHVRWYRTHGERFHTSLVAIYGQDRLWFTVGSANLTRRSLGDYNLEANVAVEVPRATPLAAQLLRYYDTLWGNRAALGIEYSADFAVFADPSPAGYLVGRVMEASGLSAY